MNWTWNKCMTWNIKESIASLYTSLYKVIYWLLKNLVPLSGLYRSWTYSSQTIFVFLSSSFVFWVITPMIHWLMHHGWRHDDVNTPVTYWYRSNVEEEYKKDEIRQKLWNFKNEKITTFFSIYKNTVSKSFYLLTKAYLQFMVIKKIIIR